MIYIQVICDLCIGTQGVSKIIHTIRSSQIDTNIITLHEITWKLVYAIERTIGAPIIVQRSGTDKQDKQLNSALISASLEKN